MRAASGGRRPDTAARAPRWRTARGRGGKGIRRCPLSLRRGLLDLRRTPWLPCAVDLLDSSPEVRQEAVDFSSAGTGSGSGGDADRVRPASSCLRINSVSLRSIGVRAQHYRTTGELKFVELIIENAPCLEKLLHLDQSSDLRVSVFFAPKLEIFRCFSGNSTKISFGSTVIQGLRVESLTTVVRTIKILAVDMDILSLDTVIGLMKCFPCLEKLYIQSCDSGPNNLWLRKHKNLIRCHDIRLKKIVIEFYWGIRSQVSFITFFVLNARILELMTLRIEAKNNNEEFLAQHRRKLQLENRASRGARFQFTTDKCSRDIWKIKHAHDLDLPDPFAC
ncbi:hypothetical protein ACQ4PT_052259 [Festuca glaucescens]